MERDLPIISIKGTDFVVDVINGELRERDRQQNIMDIKYMNYVGNGKRYTFFYDLITKNLPTKERISEIVFTDNNEVQEVKIPELNSIDPIGMAKKHNLSLEEVKGRTDFELTIKPGSLLDLRWNKGILPTLDIYGHTFYVDLQMDMLRAKDDFRSKGIVFSDIQNFYDENSQRYFIPYHPKAHEFRKIDYETITQIPKDLIVVSFYHETILDPVGWIRKYGFDPIEGMDNSKLKVNFKATTETWAHIFVPEKIKENLAKINEHSDKQKPPNPKEKKGRKL